ncbi:MAG: sigma-70 region 4 domain-containing protein [Pseudomonadota bacterium]
MFLLSQFAGMPYDSIAAQLGISVATVKRRLARAIALCTAHFRD